MSFSPYRAVSGVDGLVGLSSFCINKLSVNEQLMRHLYGHVVDVLLHLCGRRSVSVTNTSQYLQLSVNSNTANLLT